MTTKLNNTEKICFDSLSNDPKNVEISPNDFILKHIEQEFDQVPVHLRKQILNELCKHASQNTNEVTIIYTRTRKKVSPKKKPIFGYRGTVEQLTVLLLEVDKEIPLFEKRSLVHVFAGMATCSDLSKCHKKMPLACMTKEFKCFVDNFKPLCKSFNPTTIERCGLFVSKIGNTITANDLYNSTTDTLPTRALMESIFKRMC